MHVHHSGGCFAMLEGHAGLMGDCDGAPLNMMAKQLHYYCVCSPRLIFDSILSTPKACYLKGDLHAGRRGACDLE